ncbi:MAG TPA: tetratricopeptide repeat protein [Planctomycetes bacterium]|nr:tetratricopeptide repeat protein [Planctomycetota bacterium]
MTYTFTCPNCSAELEADLARNALVVECPVCSTSFNAAGFLSPDELALLPDVLEEPVPAQEEPVPETPDGVLAEVNLGSWMDDAEEPVETAAAETEDEGSTKIIEGTPEDDPEFLALAAAGTDVQQSDDDALEAAEAERPAAEPGTLQEQAAAPTVRRNAPAAEARGDEVIGDYILISKIGGTDVAVTYRARHISTNKVVALKVLLGCAPWAEQEASRIIDHLKSLPLLELAHDNIAAVYEMDEADGVPYVASEYVEGRSLSSFLEEGVSISEILSIVDDVADALSYAHGMGVVHGDIKPSNIIIDSYGSPKVVDFGFFRSPDVVRKAGISDEFSAKRAGYEFPHYAAPEQVDGGENYVESDVYSLGAVIYHFLAGRPPHSSDNLTRLCLRIRDEAPRPVRLLNPDVQPSLQAVVLKCLAKPPAQRYHTCEGLKAEIHRLMTGAPVHAEKQSAGGRAAGALLRVAALVVLVAGGYYTFRYGYGWASAHFAAPAASRAESVSFMPEIEDAVRLARKRDIPGAGKILASILPDIDLLPEPERSRWLPGVCCFLARVAEDAGDLAAADDMYRRILAVDGDNAIGLYGAGKMLYLAEDYAEAADKFGRLTALNPDDRRARLAHGLSLWGAGELERATEELRKAVEMDPSDEDARRYLAEVEKSG